MYLWVKYFAIFSDLGLFQATARTVSMSVRASNKQQITVYEQYCHYELKYSIIINLTCFGHILCANCSPGQKRVDLLYFLPNCQARSLLVSSRPLQLHSTQKLDNKIACAQLNIKKKAYDRN